MPVAGSRNDLDGAIAATRFGLGAKAGEIAEASRDPRRWLKAQVPPRARRPGAPGERRGAASVRTLVRS
jgi:uncharacterized protein (DUF1800 family)